MPPLPPVVIVLSKRVRECTHYKLDGVGGHQLSVGLTQTCIAIAVPRTASSRLRLEYMEGFKVFQCIKIDSFYICFVRGCCLP